MNEYSLAKVQFMLICYYVLKKLLCLIDSAKVRRFQHSHNPDFVAFCIPHLWYKALKAIKRQHFCCRIKFVIMLAVSFYLSLDIEF